MALTKKRIALLLLSLVSSLSRSHGDSLQYGHAKRQRHIVESTDSVPLFGTKNGYDVGGDDPICWVSELRLLMLSKNTSNISTAYAEYVVEDEKIDAVTDILFEGAQEMGEGSAITTLLPECYGGLNLSVIPLDIPSNRQLEINKDYTFRVDLLANLTQISEGIANQVLNGTVDIYVRLLLCDVMKQGFCNPMRDTRSKEDSLELSDTDADIPNASDYDQAKYDYDEGKALRGVQDGPLIFTRWVHWKFNETSAQNSSYTSSIDITVRFPAGTRRSTYFFVGHGVFNFDFKSGTVYRVDIAEAIPDHVVEVRAAPEILVVSTVTKAILGAAIGIFGSVALATLVFILLHLDHIVMRLTQGPFLAAIAFACLVQIVFAFTALPTRDVFCVLRGPMSLIPQTFIAAVLVGRVWRVYSTLSAVNNLGRTEKKSESILENILVSCLGWLANPLSFFKMNRNSQNNRGIRRSITAKDSMILIINLSLPQIVTQIASSSYFKYDLELVLNSDETVGRQMCTGGDGWPEAVGVAYSAFIFIIAISIAWISRGLPSAFNEKNEIFKVTFLSFFLTSAQLVIYPFMNNPTVDPNFVVYIKAFFTIGVAVFILNSILWPKIKRVRDGEKVVVGKILDSRFSNPSVRSSLGITLPDTQTNISEGKEERTEIIQICKGDPLPAQVERKIQDLQHLLNDISNQIFDGRAVCTGRLGVLRQALNSLHESLNRMEVLDLSEKINEAAPVKDDTNFQ